jgi:hypothetical protein
MHCHAKAGIMPSTHRTKERQNPALVVGLGVDFSCRQQFFAEHYGVVEDIMKN